MSGSLTGKAVAGTHTVLLGMSTTHRKGCLGFAIHRTDHTEGEAYWLRGMKTFASVEPEPAAGQSFATNVHPVQSFQWGDYTAKPEHRYTYRIVALSGSPGSLRPVRQVELEVVTEPEDDGRHGIWFNRGVAGSQAYSRRFPDVPGDAPDSHAALKWLARGLDDAFHTFVAEAAGPGWELRGAFYEFTWPAGLDSFRAAHLRGADVRLVVHGRDSDPAGKDDDRTSASARASAAEARILGLVDWRSSANKTSLQHNKFLVLLHDGHPEAVWTGSTNLTRGAVFGHSNVAHVIRDRAVAASFAVYWERLKADEPTGAMRVWTEANDSRDTSLPVDRGASTVFSPRSTSSRVLEWYAELFDGAVSSAHITGAFGLNAVFRDKLSRERAIPRTVLLDKELANARIPRNDRDVRISTGAHLRGDGLGQWASERLTGFNGHVPYIHTKVVLVDPLGHDPIVLTGSANYSAASTTDNDENTLLIRGDERVADIYLTEYHRLFMHFPFRKWAAETEADAPPYLAEDDSWTTDYYVADHWRARQRRLFSGA